MPKTTELVRRQMFPSSNKVTDFWQQGLFSSFDGVNSIDIHYAAFSQKDQNSRALLIVPGRSESYLKYQELAFDFYNQGYHVFIIDHRGQGLSGRLVSNSNKGYVDNFQDYVDDLQSFVENIIMKNSASKPFLLAHSMGGAIATRFMQESPDAIQAAVIASPMLGFNSGYLPKTIANLLVDITLFINKKVSKTQWYFLGQGNYNPALFSNNKLSHSTKRYQDFIDLYRDNKKIQLGGVTSHWLAASLVAQKEIFSKINQLRTPLLLLQAGMDSIVCQQAQNDFCQKLHALQPQSCPEGVPATINGAYHEIFFEIDEYRNNALSQTLSWFRKYE